MTLALIYLVLLTFGVSLEKIEFFRLLRYKPATLRGSGKAASVKKGASPGAQLARKPISGGKNGEVRLVPAARSPRSVPTQQPHRGATRQRVHLAKNQVRHFRKSLQPGTVVILLSGVHRGKRVVLIKHLESGLLLVSGPYKVTENCREQPTE